MDPVDKAEAKNRVGRSGVFQMGVYLIDFRSTPV
jgi:hypothetical protein